MGKYFNDHGRYRSGNALFINDQGMHDPPFSEEFPLLVDCYAFDRNFVLTPNFHSYVELTYVYEGEGVFSSGRDVFDISPGDLIVVGNSEIHRFEATTPKLKLAALFFLPQLIHRPGISHDEAALVEFFFDTRKISNHRIRQAEVERMGIRASLQEIYDLFLAKTKWHRVRSRIVLMEALLRLAEYYDTLVDGASADPIPVHHVERLRQIFRIVEESYSEKIDLNDVAAATNLSRGYFCRFFRQHTGMSLSEYINRVRIDKAKELLLKGKLSVTQVSYEVGFESLPYFYRVFRELAGMNPGEFLQTFSPVPEQAEISMQRADRVR